MIEWRIAYGEAVRKSFEQYCKKRKGKQIGNSSLDQQLLACTCALIEAVTDD